MGRGRNISIDERREWLRQHELGKPIDEVAGDAHRSQQSVSDGIQRARSEREIERARVAVIHDAYAKHFEELVAVAGDLSERAADRTATDLLAWSNDRNGLLGAALQKHLPRSRIWRACRNWNRYARQLSTIEDLVRQAIEGEVRRQTKGAGRLLDPLGFVDGLVAAAIAYAEDKLISEDYLNYEPTADGIYLRDGVVWISRPARRKASLEKVRRAYQRLRDEFTDPSFSDLKRLKEATLDWNEARETIAEEVDVLRLRRVITGQCFLCPAGNGKRPRRGRPRRESR